MYHNPITMWPKYQSGFAESPDKAYDVSRTMMISLNSL